MNYFDQSLHWLGDQPMMAAVFAAALTAIALLATFAATLRLSRGEKGGGLAMSVDLLPAADHASADRPTPARPVGTERPEGRPAIQDNLLFLSRWIKAPLRIGAVVPSSRSLARAMAAQLPPEYEICVELGGGTGSLTRSLLESGVPPEKLVVLERDPQLAALLRKRFPKVRVVQGDAGRLASILRAHGIGQVDAIMSSLPLVSMPRRVRQRVVAGGFAALKPGGVFVQYTYGLMPPVPRREAARLQFAGTLRARIWQNIPPAAVWRYRRAA